MLTIEALEAEVDARARILRKAMNLARTLRELDQMSSDDMPNVHRLVQNAVADAYEAALLWNTSRAELRRQIQLAGERRTG